MKAGGTQAAASIKKVHHHEDLMMPRTVSALSFHVALIKIKLTLL